MEPDKMEALSDLFNLFDPKLMDKAMVKSGLGTAINGMKPSTKFFADLDDMLWDQLKNVINTFVDNLGVTKDAPLTVGAGESFTAADVDAYLGTFDGVDPDVQAAQAKGKCVGNYQQPTFGYSKVCQDMPMQQSVCLRMQCRQGMRLQQATPS